ncbi:cellulose binding domain-containing protein [Lentzea sp. BCCO 10_0856]|uniref:Cellulose binding domain-containing protein n=1 Tax=Lentzea miocenica TaxID=3095431 RepID=A0ABU4SST7_9PSEU|nr:cellulose binding domain-containing protein [Lentzea sp. BCCO 10_0856]MDX8028972.1 cellulose binding domain-containing protein [Lentzea sp. BCCO 10_0856]
MAARKHLLVLLTLFLAACTAEQGGTPHPAPRVSSPPPVENLPSTKVRSIFDGRTVELADGTRARISLLAEPASCTAAAALDFATKTLLDKEVRVNSITPGEVSLMLPDGTDFALAAVSAGMMRTSGVDGGPLMDAETRASKAKLGLWAEECPTSTPAPPPPTSTSAAPPPASPCVVVYRITSTWPGSFQAEVTVRNVSGALIDGWTLRWQFTDGQTVTQMWNATASQSGADVSVTNAGYTSLIVADGSISLGFNGTVNGLNAVPTTFTLNGAACTTG